MIHHGLTAALYMHLFMVEDELWAVIEFDADGRVLMRRERDAPWYGEPGVAYYRWFDARVLSEAQQRKWD